MHDLGDMCTNGEETSLQKKYINHHSVLVSALLKVESIEISLAGWPQGQTRLWKQAPWQNPAVYIMGCSIRIIPSHGTPFYSPCKGNPDFPCFDPSPVSGQYLLRMPRPHLAAVEESHHDFNSKLCLFFWNSGVPLTWSATPSCGWIMQAGQKLGRSGECRGYSVSLFQHGVPMTFLCPGW